jgi:threonylcarbamoyladenosine tRNA methylthiotransferase MtaB
MKFAVLTLGCKTNLSESDEIKRQVISTGGSLVSLGEDPDYCIINTCTVTGKSDYQSRQLIRRALRAGAKVVVTGCYAQLRPAEIKEISEDIKIYNITEKIHIVKDIIGKNSSRTLDVRDRSYLAFRRTRPFIKIQDGCNHSCTYCNITLARGRSRSLEIEDILCRIAHLEEEGFREVVLTGVHIGLYGSDLNTKAKLADLVNSILKNSKKIRVRLGSLEVNELDEEIINLLGHPRLCSHIHIPLQSGDDRILRRMNRLYSARDFFRKVEKLASEVKGISIGTDVIVGFPGEDDKSFRQTAEMIADSALTYLHIFPFSPRPGTVAAGMPGEVPGEIKKERVRVLRETDRKLRLRFRHSQILEILDVIGEEVVEDGYIKGKSSNYLNIYYKNKRFQQGELVEVKIDELFRDGLRGIATKIC